MNVKKMGSLLYYWDITLMIYMKTLNFKEIGMNCSMNKVFKSNIDDNNYKDR